MNIQNPDGPVTVFVNTQGSDGVPVAVPARAGGPIIEPSGTPQHTGIVGYEEPPPSYESCVNSSRPITESITTSSCSQTEAAYENSSFLLESLTHLRENITDPSGPPLSIQLENIVNDGPPLLRASSTQQGETP
jgi:hypothetical protein